MVAFVHDAPHVVGPGLQCEARAVAQAGGVIADRTSLPDRIHAPPRGFLLRPRRRRGRGFSRTRGFSRSTCRACRPRRDSMPSRRRGTIVCHRARARDRASNAASSEYRRRSLRPGPGLDRAISVRKAHHLVGRCDVDVPRTGGGVKDDAVGFFQVLGEDFGLRRQLARGSTEHQHASGAALRQENVAIRRDAQRARLFEPSWRTRARKNHPALSEVLPAALRPL